jgi:ATP-binding cassette, subfamily C, bacterial
MRRELRVGVAGLRRRPFVALVAWSVPEALPTAVTGLAIAHAVDSGFLAGRPAVGLAWLGGLMLAAVVGAAGSHQVYRRLGDLVEPFRDDLVRRVVGGALRHGVAGRADDGAVARLTRQVEIVRDSYSGLIVLLNGFVVTVTGVALGLLTIDPVVAALVLPPFVLGFAVFIAMLGMAAARYLTAVRADERLAGATGEVLAGVRDVVAGGTEEHAARLVIEPIHAQAAAERALAHTAAQRTLSFAIGGWLPLVVLLVAGPWLVSRGVTAGAIMGGLTYILFGLQPALGTISGGLGDAGLRYVVTLGRVLDASTPPPAPARPATAPAAHDLILRGVTFAYGPDAEPVLHDLDLTVPEGDHLAIVGSSGIGKSTLAGLLCGLLPPGTGTVLLGGAPTAKVAVERLAEARVLIPQEAYVFAGPVRDNITYLNPAATDAQVRRAVAAVGAEALVVRLGGTGAELVPGELSAGERQLLALARAYLSPAPLVVLDEATCHLDPVAERRAEEAFAGRGGTLIVIAHRISSALRARRVLVLDGAGATVGDNDTLRATSPLYRELLGHWEVTASGRTPGHQDPAALDYAR